MKLNPGDMLYHFTVTRVRENAELGGVLTEMTHDVSGTPLCWLNTGERNKLFAVAFKTLPEDSTGVFHILEHSVLCGSDKYPVREPFVELLKSSMNTFLNAMTFPDKTVYPVSSRNDQDFLNLTEVYLDAVFAPRILRDPNIFYQEGWHIEENDGKLSYKGVVFNEMKGAMSGVDDLVYQKMQSLIFPNTPYGFNSGGDPACIPDLTYEQFLDTYRRFYHPSNARIYLDGDIPLERTLALIDGYLSAAGRSRPVGPIPLQKPVSANAEQEYEISADEPIENKAELTLGKIVSTWQDQVRTLAVGVLGDVLAGSNEAPLKRAVLASGLAQDLSFDLDGDSISQPTVLIRLKNIRDGKAEELRELLRGTARELIGKGIDKKALEASVNRLEFRLREPEEPAGLIRCFNALTGWLHGGDPLQFMTHDEELSELRSLLKTDTFEELLRTLLLDDEGLSVLLTTPSRTVGERLREQEDARLKAISADWTDADHQRVAELNSRLTAWQQTEDTPEQLATLPVLPLSAVSDKPEWTPTEQSVSNGVKVLYHPAACRGIVHLTLYFRLTDFTLEELSLLSLAQQLLGSLPTKKHEALELEQLLKNTVGHSNFGLTAFAQRGDTARCTPCLTASVSALEDKLPQAIDLLTEILTQTCFDRRDRIRELIVQADEDNRQAVIMSGHSLGMSAVLSHSSSAGAVAEAVAGRTGILSLRDLAKNFDARIDGFTELMERIQKQIVCRARLTVSVTAARKIDVGPLTSALPEGSPVPADAAYRLDLPLRMGLRIPAQIGFAVQGCNLRDLGATPHGSQQVAANILTLSYFWNRVRVQGGAYGTGLRIRMGGSMFTYSFRDPTPGASLNVNREASAYLRQLCENPEPIDKFILSTVAATEPLIGPREQGMLADSRFLNGFTREDEIRTRQEMLHTTKEDLLALCGLLDRFAQNAPVCVVAHEGQLAGCPDLTVLDL